MPRIITGQAKGVKLLMPAGDFCRPTPGRTKEALFSILADRVEGSRVLDVFSGSGQIGLEALSRGARQVVMIESDRRALAVLDENIRRTGLGARAVVLAGDYRHRLRGLAGGQDAFDLIYLDPPWTRAVDYMEKASALLYPLLAPEGLVVIETRAEELPEHLFDPVLSRLRRSQYGTGVQSFYQFRPDESAYDEL